MYSIIYLVVVSLVTSLLLAIPLFPFWKVWHRLKTHHYDIWMAKGPFDLVTMAAHSSAVGSFMEVVSLAERDEELVKRDPELIKWTRLSREVTRMVPRSFLAQVGYACLFIYFVLFFTSIIMGIFR